MGLVIALIAAICSGFSAVFSRSLKQIPLNVVVFYHSLSGLTIALLYILIDALVSNSDGGLRILSYTGQMYGICAISAVLDNLCLYLFVVAYTSDTSGFVSILSYMRIVWAYITDVLVFDQELKVS